ncbi:MAG TPA: succinate dehydrogenase, hydrophobic membrane anchor protein [Caulobacterales bacterium]|nr:succinate dehydrogenase, hydrophobic membrane anchor protein [Caulobacterales bacterium]
MAKAHSPTMRTPLGRVRGHGAGHGGTGHFIGERVSSLALLILSPWFVITAALEMRDPSFVSALDFISDPVNAVGVILLLAAGLYHMSLGMQVIVEDYVHKPAGKTLLLAANFLLCVALAAAAIYAVLHVNFSGD